MSQYKHHQSGSWVERTGGADTVELPSEPLESPEEVNHTLHKHGFSRSHTSLGIAGHIVHMAGVFVPLVAGELVQEAAKYKKTVRIASIGTALAYEVLYTVREQQRQKELKERLADCRGRE